MNTMRNAKRAMRTLMLPIAVTIAMLMLSSCSFPGITSTNAQLPVVSGTPQTASLPPVRLPQDEGAHNDLTEWWYYTGHLTTSDSRGTHNYGFELVIFQALRSNFPPVYTAHFAISDITRGQFHYDQRRVTEPNAVIPNGTSAQGMNEHVGDWSMVGINGLDHLQAEMQNYAIQLDLHGLKPAILHNGTGLINYGVGGFSYYYSRTRMAVSGTIVDHSQKRTVAGLAWMDHQWGNFLSLGNGGWDWYSIQLNNNTEVMLYFIHDANGNVVSTYADYISANAQTYLVPTSSIHDTVLGRWVSPITKSNYPSGWKLSIDDPHVQLSLTITPLLKDQELVVYQSTGNAYWEGAVSIQGQHAGTSVQGEGYVELTGYMHS